jgi:hypothetical protein
VFGFKVINFVNLISNNLGSKAYFSKDMGNISEDYNHALIMKIGRSDNPLTHPFTTLPITQFGQLG